MRRPSHPYRALPKISLAPQLSSGEHSATSSVPVSLHLASRKCLLPTRKPALAREWKHGYFTGQTLHACRNPSPFQPIPSRSPTPGGNAGQFETHQTAGSELEEAAAQRAKISGKPYLLLFCYHGGTGEPGQPVHLLR